MGKLHQMPKPELVAHYPWDRQDTDTEKAYQAFEIYRQLGPSRSLVRVAEKSGKHISLIERWSRRDGWQLRVIAWDRHESRYVNERILAGTASMRERQITLAMQMQARAQNRILSMDGDEIKKMRPVEVCAIMRVASEIERKAREIPEEDMDAPIAEMVPKFEIQIIKPGEGMVGVQMGDGRYGYIPVDQVDRFRRDYPGAVVIT